MAQSSQEAFERWRQHFAFSEQGLAVNQEQLQQLAQAEHRRHHLADILLDLMSIPTVAKIESYITQARKFKTPGIDGLPVDQLAPQFFANQFWPFLKCTLRIAEPMRWRGGEICSLPKTAHASLCADQFRSIMLSDFPAKLRHGILRRKLLPQLCQLKENMQAKGIPRLSPDFMHLFVQSYAVWAHSKCFSHAFVFVDTKQAFYKACRPLLAPRPFSETAIVQLVAQNGWSPDLLHSFTTTLQEPDALLQASVTRHLRAQIDDILSGTWFQMRSHNETLSHTTAGTRPGDSVADMLLAFIMTRYIKRLKQKFIEADLHTNFDLQWIPAGRFEAGEIEGTSVIQGCWGDDLVLLLSAESPQAVIASTCTQLSRSSPK